MADESHIPLLDREDFAQYDEKLRRWAQSLDTTPEQLKDILRGGGEGAQYVRQLLGIKAAS